MEEAICWGQIWKEKVPGPSWNGNREDLWKGEAQKHFWHLLHLNKYQILCVFPLRVLVALQLSPLFASVFQKPQGGIEGVRDCYQISWSRTYKGSEDSVKTVAKSNRGRKWESQFQCDSKSPICEEDIIRASLVDQQVKNPSAMQETWVRSLGWEDPLEKGKSMHSSVLTWRIPWTV